MYGPVYRQAGTACRAPTSNISYGETLASVNRDFLESGFPPKTNGFWRTAGGELTCTGTACRAPTLFMSFYIDIYFHLIANRQAAVIQGLVPVNAVILTVEGKRTA